MKRIKKMGECSSREEKKEVEQVESDRERLEKIESVFLRDINKNDRDYLLAQRILNERSINQYGNMMRNAPNNGFQGEKKISGVIQVKKSQE